MGERECVGVSEGESVRMCDAVPLADCGASVCTRVGEGAGATISPPSSESPASGSVLALVLGLVLVLVLVLVLLGLVISVIVIGWVKVRVSLCL